MAGSNWPKFIKTEFNASFCGVPGMRSSPPGDTVASRNASIPPRVGANVPLVGNVVIFGTEGNKVLGDIVKLAVGGKSVPGPEGTSVPFIIVGISVPGVIVAGGRVNDGIVVTLGGEVNGASVSPSRTKTFRSKGGS